MQLYTKQNQTKVTWSVGTGEKLPETSKH